MPDELLSFNGIDALTGEPLLPPLPVEVVTAMAQGQPIAKEDLDAVRERQRCLVATPTAASWRAATPTIWPRPVGASSSPSRTRPAARPWRGPRTPAQPAAIPGRRVQEHLAGPQRR